MKRIIEAKFTYTDDSVNVITAAPVLHLSVFADDIHVIGADDKLVGIVDRKLLKKITIANLNIRDECIVDGIWDRDLGGDDFDCDNPERTEVTL